MLTKDANFMLHTLYKEYLARRNVGASQAASKQFRSAKSVRENFLPDWSLDDVQDAMCELGRNGYLNNHHADNTIYCSELTDEAIAMMENLPKETLLNVADLISKFIP